MDVEVYRAELKVESRTDPDKATVDSNSLKTYKLTSGGEHEV